MTDTMVLLDKHKEYINQDRLKETLEGVDKGDADAEWKQGGQMCMIFSYGRSASDFGKVIEQENYWYHKAAEDGCPYAMLDLANMVNGVKELLGWRKKRIPPISGFSKASSSGTPPAGFPNRRNITPGGSPRPARQQANLLLLIRGCILGNMHSVPWGHGFLHTFSRF